MESSNVRQRAQLTFWHVSKRHSTIAQAFKPGIALSLRTSSPEGTAEIARLHGSAQKLRFALRQPFIAAMNCRDHLPLLHRRRGPGRGGYWSLGFGASPPRLRKKESLCQGSNE